MGLFIDCFAGGGGASLGIRWALGRDVDIAINHDRSAVAMHKVNHPRTRHYTEDIHDVDPLEATGGQHVDGIWLNPDCRHHSRAKGGKPVEQRIRSLPWITCRWAGQTEPDLIVFENVPEIVTWGPLIAKRDKATRRVIKRIPLTIPPKSARGRNQTVYIERVAEPGEVVPRSQQSLTPDPRRKGLYFRRFVRHLQGLGYTVERRILVACDYGAPTSRKRLFLIASRHGRPAWPAPTYGPDREHPYRTAAECINFADLGQSIFGRKKPLAPNTMRRIAKGINKFVIDNPSPFIVSLNHTADYYQCFRGQALEEPLGTITQAPGYSLVTPHIETYYGDKSESGDLRGLDVDKPLQTQTTENRHALVSAALVKQNFGEKPCQKADEPLHTITTQGNKFQLASAFLAKHYTGVVGTKVEKPIDTITGVDHHSLVVAHLDRQFGKSSGASCGEPTPTIVAGGAGKTLLATSHLLHLKGTCKDGQDVRDPLRTINAQGLHFAEVRCFLLKYYATNIGQEMREPLHTITTKDRLGLVSVKGEDYMIADIYLRMLRPRELARAQGFPDSYVIEHDGEGHIFTNAKQVKMIGNSVPPHVAAAIIRANVKNAVQEAVA